MSDLKAFIVPAGKHLKRYTKIDLKVNQTKTVKFTIHTSDLRFSDSNGDWITEDGEFMLEINGENCKFELN